MNTKRLVLILVSSVSIALLAGCREPNAPQAQSQAGPVQSAPVDAGAEAMAVPGGKPDSTQPVTLCNIEAIGDQLVGASPLVLEASTRVKGWLADHSGTPPDGPRLVLADPDENVVREIPIQLSLERPDVAKAYPGQKGLATSGFEAQLDLAGLQPQTYHLYLAYSVGQANYSCDNGRYVEVR